MALFVTNLLPPNSIKCSQTNRIFYASHNGYSSSTTEDSSDGFVLYDRYICTCIADGHKDKAYFSSRVTSFTSLILEKHLESHPSDIEQVLKNVIAELHHIIDSYAKNDGIRVGGCTFTLCVVDKQRSCAFFANLGDSPGFVLSKDLSAPSGFRIKFRTKDHDANSIDERNRIENLVPKPCVTFSNNYMSMSHGLRIMTLRGFGDYSFGITIGREPQTYTVELESGDIIILSSDGLLERYNGTKLVAGRDENEICEDVSKAIEMNQDIGSVLIQRKITRLANTIIQAKKMEPNKTNFKAMCKEITSAMDNHMIVLFQFESNINTKH